MKALSNFTRSLGLLVKDKWIFIFSMIPILIGGVLFYYVGKEFFYGYLLNYGENLINRNLEGGSVFLGWLLKIILIIPFYFLVSWTFVLIVSIIASPFNDLISSRVEKLVLGREMPSISSSLGQMFKNFFKIIVNEIKKIFLVFALVIVALLFNLIPLLVPVSLFFTGLVMAMSFLDYNWSRRDWVFSKCVSDIKGQALTYGLSGILFSFLMTVPIVNLFALPYGVIYYSSLWTDKNLMETDEVSLANI